MKSKRIHASNTRRLEELRLCEKNIIREPSAEGYLKLADEYRLLGMGKEADRLMQLAELFECEAQPADDQTSADLLSGTATPVMIVEVTQILSRTRLSGEFVIDAPPESFHLFFDQGHIINACSRKHAPGFKSFQQALRVPKGTYHFVQKSIGSVDRLIDEQTEILLLNAMQEADEQASLEAQL